MLRPAASATQPTSAGTGHPADVARRREGAHEGGGGHGVALGLARTGTGRGDRGRGQGHGGGDGHDQGPAQGDAAGGEGQADGGRRGVVRPRFDGQADGGHGGADDESPAWPDRDRCRPPAPPLVETAMAWPMQ